MAPLLPTRASHSLAWAMPLTLRATSRSKEVDAEPEEGSSPGARRLKHALLSLNQVEENRILTSGDLSKESDLYEGISYSLDVGSLRQHREANRYGNILSCEPSRLLLPPCALAIEIKLSYPR